MLALGPTPPLDDATTHHLEALVRSGATPQRVAQRCRVVLMAAAGVSNRAIAQHLALSRPTVIATRQALGVRGVEALTGKQKRRRARPTLTAELEQRILDTTLKTRPSDGTPGSVRVLAKQLAVSRMMVHRAWQRFEIQPHRVERFRLSKDPRFLRHSSRSKRRSARSTCGQPPAAKHALLSRHYSRGCPPNARSVPGIDSLSSTAHTTR